MTPPAPSTPARRAPRHRQAAVLALAGCALAVLVSAAPASAGNLSITPIAGTGVAGPATVGTATSSDLNTPKGVAVDSSGNVYIADQQNNEVERVTPGGQLTIIAGTGTSGAPTTGPAASSELSHPTGVAVDANKNVYIADTGNNDVEEVSGGTLRVIAGQGPGGGGLPTAGTATASALNVPQGVAVDGSGDVYIADTANNDVEEIAGGQLTIVAGSSLGTQGTPTAGPAANSDLNHPTGLAVDGNGNLYIADTGNDEIEKVTEGGTLSVFAGTGTANFPTPGPATASDLDLPTGVATDGAGNVYIADNSDGDTEEVTPGDTLSIYTDTPAIDPFGIAATAGGTLFIGNTNHNVVDRVDAAPGAPTGLGFTPGQGSAVLTFTPPANTGTSAISGYEVSTDDGTTWQPLTTTSGAAGTLQATLTGLTAATTYLVLVRADNTAGAGAASVALSLSLTAATTTTTITTTSTTATSATSTTSTTTATATSTSTSTTAIQTTRAAPAPCNVGLTFPHESHGAVSVSASTPVLPLTIRWPALTSGSCTIRVLLATTETYTGSKLMRLNGPERARAARAKTTKRTVIVGGTTFTIGNARSQTTRIALNALGLSLLRSMHSVPLHLTITQHGRLTATQLVTARLLTARRRT